MLSIKLAVVFALVLFLQGCYGQTQATIQSQGFVNVLGSNNWEPFSCRRPGDACYGGICQTDNTCDCSSVTGSGRDCNPITTNTVLALTACPDSCSNRGTCYDVSGTPTCFCDPEYANANCDRFRAFVLCDPASMDVFAYPQKTLDPFVGQISIQKRGTNELITDASCQFKSTGVFWTAADNSFVVNFSTMNTSGNPCVDGLYVQPQADDMVSVCYDMRLQYSQVFQSAEDEVFRLCCNENSAIVNNGVDVGSSNNGDTGANLTGTIRVISNELVFTNDRTTIVPTNGVLSIGDKISYKVTLETGARYADFRVTECIAQPSNIPLVTNKCPDKDAAALVRDIVKIGSSIYVDLSVWNPTDANLINVTCATQLCVTSCGPLETCSKSTVVNYGRKKRQAPEEDNETVYTSKSFYIGLELPEQTCPVAAPCTIQHVNSVYIPVMVVFGVLLLIALAISIFMCLKFRSREQKETSSDHPKAYYNSAMS